MIFFKKRAYTIQQKIFLGSDFRLTADVFQMKAELHLLQEDERKYLNNPLIGYLNTNSVCNKMEIFRCSQKVYF